MAELDYMTLQQHYGGKYVATRNGEVIDSDESYEELSDRLERPDMDWDGVIIGYVERPDVIRV